MLLSKTCLNFCSPKAPITTNRGGEGSLLKGCKHSSVVAVGAMCAAQDLGETSLGEISILRHISGKNVIFKFTYNAVFHVQSNCLTSSEQTAYIGCSFLLITF